MAVAGLKPNFNDRESYIGWCKVWAMAYNRLSEDIRKMKKRTRYAQKAGLAEEAAKMQKDLFLMRRDGLRMMSLLEAAKVRRDRIIAMHEQLKAQPFPLVIEDCRSVDFHFNKGSLEFPFLPNWTVKAKGVSYYVSDVVAEKGFSTKNKETGTTRGLLRFSRCNLRIDAEGVATIS